MIDTYAMAVDRDRLQALLDRARVAAWPQQRELATMRKAAAKRLSKVSGKVAVLPMRGIIEQRMSEWSYWFGGCGSDDLGRAVDILMANKDVQAIVLDIDSPGGTVPGCQALSDKLFKYRGVKQLIGIANSCACSAAYWIGSACDQFYAAPGSCVGSIGVYQVHVDYSKMQEEAGLKVTYIHAGKYKVEGNSDEPLGDEAKAHLQSLVDEDYRQFTDSVARNRGVKANEVRRDFGEGRYFISTAVPAGMIDGVKTLEEVLAKLAGTPATEQESRRGTQVLKLRQAQRVRKGVA